MRFLRQRPSGQDKDIPVFEFAFGIEELRLLTGMVELTRENIPKNVLETNPTRNRLNNIYKEFSRVLNEYNKKTE